MDICSLYSCTCGFVADQSLITSDTSFTERMRDTEDPCGLTVYDSLEGLDVDPLLVDLVEHVEKELLPVCADYHEPYVVARELRLGKPLGGDETLIFLEVLVGLVAVLKDILDVVARGLVDAYAVLLRDITDDVVAEYGVAAVGQMRGHALEAVYDDFACRMRALACEDLCIARLLFLDVTGPCLDCDLVRVCIHRVDDVDVVGLYLLGRIPSLCRLVLAFRVGLVELAQLDRKILAV